MRAILILTLLLPWQIHGTDNPYESPQATPPSPPVCFAILEKQAKLFPLPNRPGTVILVPPEGSNRPLVVFAQEDLPVEDVASGTWAMSSRSGSQAALEILGTALSSTLLTGAVVGAGASLA